MSHPRFQHKKDGFHIELKKRVNQYFIDNHRPTTGNVSIFIKAILLCFGYLAIYVHLVFFTPPLWLSIPECILFGCLTAAIGFNVMHDGAHGAFSKYKIINKMAGASLNFLGASAIMWNLKHNIIHHTYTNIDGVDDDIEARPWMRFASSQKKFLMHRFQHYYFWFLYSLLHLIWIFLTDFQKYFRKKIGTVPIRRMTAYEHFSFWAAKIIYMGMFVFLPIYLLGFSTWIIGFLLITMVTGLVISMVFQLAHTVEHTEFPLPDENTGKMENEWAIHQIKTTANFATKNKTISWLVGGLNFQIEHHLFPKISHVHYPAISKITKKLCLEYGIDYIEFPKMRHAVFSHIMYLKRLGQSA